MSDQSAAPTPAPESAPCDCWKYDHQVCDICQGVSSANAAQDWPPTRETSTGGSDKCSRCGHRYHGASHCRVLTHGDRCTCCAPVSSERDRTEPATLGNQIAGPTREVAGDDMCDRCWQTRSQHSGLEQFCPFYSTFRLAPLQGKSDAGGSGEARTTPSPTTTLRESLARMRASLSDDDKARIDEYLAEKFADGGTAPSPVTPLDAKSFFDALDRFEKLGDGWAGDPRDKAPHADAIATARRVLTAAGAAGVKSWRIAPDIDGGVRLYFGELRVICPTPDDIRVEELELAQAQLSSLSTRLEAAERERDELKATADDLMEACKNFRRALECETDSRRAAYLAKNQAEDSLRSLQEAVTQLQAEKQATQPEKL